MKHVLSVTLLLFGSLTLQSCEGSYGSFNMLDRTPPPNLLSGSAINMTQSYATSAEKAAAKACRYANSSVTNRAEAQANSEAAIKAANTATDMAVAAHKAAVQARKKNPTADEGDIAKKAANDAKRARKCANSIRDAVLNMKPDTAAGGVIEISAEDIQGD